MAFPKFPRFFLPGKNNRFLQRHGGRTLCFLALALAGALATITVARAAGPVITALKTYALVTDADGNGFASPGDTLEYTVTISAAGADANAVKLTDTLDSNTTLVANSLSVSPVAIDDFYPQTVVGNVATDSEKILYSVLTNDYLGQNPTGTLTAYDALSLNGGNVVLNLSTGTFTYDPPAGYEGADSFTYTLSNSTGSSIGTVNLTVGGMVWFINNNTAASCTSVAAGCGRLSQPFSTLAAFNSVNGSADVPASHIFNPAANDNIFIYESPAAYSGGVTLLSGQKLIGQDAIVTLASLTGLTPPSSSALFPAMNIGAPAAIVQNAGGDAVTLSEGNLLRGLTISGTSGAGIKGVNQNTLTVGSDVTITGVSGADLDLNGGNGAVSFGARITNTAGRAVALSNRSGGTVSLSGPISDSGGTGVSLTNNTGATIDFTGGLTLSTAANAAFTATGGGNLSVQQDNTSVVNTLTTTTGTALTVVNTTIGANGLTFRSISSNGAANGIFLNNTGSLGGLTVTGNGAAGTGGTIRNSTGSDAAGIIPAVSENAGSGVFLYNTQNVILNWMQLNDHANFAVYGNTVNGFTLANSVVSGANGTNPSVDEASIAFNGLTGTAALTATSISGGVEDNFRVRNSSGSLGLTFDTVTLGANHATTGSDGINLEASGSASLNPTIKSSTFTSAAGDLFQLSLLGNAASDLVLRDSTFSNNHPAIATAGGGVTIGAGNNTGSTNLRFHIYNNTFRNSDGAGVLIFKSTDPGTVQGTFENNTIGLAGTANSGSRAGSGIKIQNAGLGAVTVNVLNNQIYQYNNFGVELLTGGGAAPLNGALNATVTGNLIANPGTGGLPMNGIHLNGGTVPSDTYSICADIGGAGGLANTINGSGLNGGTDVRLRQRQATTVRLPGYGGANNDNTAVQNYLSGRNITAPSALVGNTVPTGGGFVGGGACAQPINPVGFAPQFNPPLAQAQPGAGAAEVSKKLSRQVSWAEAHSAPASDLLLSGQAEPGGWQLVSAHLPAPAQAGETVTAGPIPTLPVGKSSVIKFRATINNPLSPVNASQLSNQGTVSGSNFTSVLTDDPGLGGAADPTLTLLPHPDLTVVKSNNVSGTVVLGNNWTWKLHVANRSTAVPASFVSPQVILVDDLPNADVTYGAASAGNGTAITNLSNVSCSIVSSTLTCAATGPVTIGTSGSFDVTFTATPGAAGTYTNPRSSGTCAVDPAAHLAESDETNNNCSADAVTVTKANSTTTLTAHTPDPSAVGQPITVNFTVTGPGATPTGSVTVSDGLGDSCTALVSAGTCDLTPMTPGSPLTLTATYAGDSNFNGSTSVGVSQTVTQPPTTVVSIDRQTPVGPTTKTSSVTWRVTLADPIAGLTSSNFSLANTGLSAPALTTVTVVTAVPATQWDVTASTGTGNGSLGLNLVNYTGLTHSVTNAPFTGQVYTVDKTAPTVTNVTSTSNSGCLFNTGLTYCNAGDVIQIQITFSEAVDVTGTPQLALNSGGAASYVSGSGSATLTFETTVAAGQNSSGLDYTSASALTLNSGTIQDAAANAATLTLASPGAAGSLGANTSLVLDTSAPTATNFNRFNPATTPTNADTLVWQAIFSESVSGVDGADFTVPALTGATILASGSADTYQVTVSGGSLTNFNGLVDLNFAPSPSITDLAGNPLTSTIVGFDQHYLLDNVAPMVTVEQASGQIDPTPFMPIHFTVTFSKPVTSFTSGNVTLTGTANPLAAVVTEIAPNDGTTYDLAVTSLGNDGAVTASLLAGVTQDAAGNLNAPSTSVDHTVTFFTATTVTNVASSTANGSYSAGTAISLQVTFSGPVNVDTSGGTPSLALNSGGTASYASGSGTKTLTFNYTVAAGENSADLDYTSASALALNGGTLLDGLGINAFLALPAPGAAGSLGANQALVIDTVPPTVTVTQTVGQSDPTNASPINFTVTFSEAVTGFATGDVDLSAGTAPGTLVGTVTGGPTIYTVAVSGLTGSGTVIASIPAGMAFDLASQPNTASPNTGDRTVTYIPPTDLSITKTDGVTSAVPGGSVTYTITASNAGPNADPAATVADTLPASLTATWTCVGAGGATCTASGSGNLNDTVNLPAGGSVTYTVSASISPAATGSLSNTATVTAGATVQDVNLSNNSVTDTDTLTPQAELGITKTDGSTTAIPGGSLTYTIQASNAGPSNVSGATVADTLPASLTATWTCVGAGGGTCPASGSGNLNTSVNLPAGGSVTFSVAASISPAATGSLSNTATVTAPGGVTDPTPSNNAATDTDTLTPQADLAITKTDGSSIAVPGTSLAYTITASNAGPSNAPGVTVADTFPASLTGVTWTCVGAGGGTCSASGVGNLNQTVNLPVGGSVTYTANATVSLSATGILSNTATVTAPGGITDPAPSNNSAADDDTVVPPVAVTLTQATGQADPTNTTPINFNAVFASPVTGFTTGDVTLGGTAGATTATVTQIAPNDGTTYNVAVSGMTGDGTVTITIAAGVATGSQGEPNAASTNTDNSVSFDATAPDTTLTSTNGLGTPPTGITTNSTSATFDFSGNDGTGVGGLTYQCKLDTGAYGACNSGTMTYPGLLDGPHTFLVKASDSLGNTDASPASHTWTVDTANPTVIVSSVTTSPTNVSPITVTITFNEPVTGFTPSVAAGDLTLGGVGGVDSNPQTISSTVYTFDLAPSAQGAVTVKVPNGSAFDMANNPNPDSNTFSLTYDTVKPTVTIDQAFAQADPTSASPINFTAIFSEDVTGLTGSSIDLSASTALGTLSAVVTGGPTTYNVAVSGMTGDGTVIASIPAGAAKDLAQNNNLASTVLSDNTVTYIAQAITSANAVTFDEGALGTFTVTTVGLPIPSLSSAGALPGGVTFVDQGNGTATLAGTPVTGASGAYPLTLTATYSGGVKVTQTFTLTVDGPAGVAKINSVVDTGDGQVDENEHTLVALTQLLVVFTKAMNPADAVDLANYSLVQDIATPITINSVSYDNLTNTATLNLNGGTALAEGRYTLTVKKTLRDTFGYGFSADFARVFWIDTTGIKGLPNGISLPNGAFVVDGSTLTPFSEMWIQFNEDAANPPGDTGKDDVTNPANYLLVSSGPNGVFDTSTCLAGVAGDDLWVPTGPINYENGGGSGPYRSLVHLNHGHDLENGIYKFLVCGTTSITDLAGNHLNNGVDQTITFTVLGRAARPRGGGAGTGSALANPATGFAPGIVTALPAQPLEKAYSDLGSLWIEIPSLGVKTSITGIPLLAQGWDLTWLNRQVGWLQGTAFPTWSGNTVLTAHAYTADGLPGPFALLKNLKYGDTFTIHLDAQAYTYTVRSKDLVSASDSRLLTKHETADWVTLITCQQYDEKTKAYLYRWVVRAVLTGVQSEK